MKRNKRKIFSSIILFYLGIPIFLLCVANISGVLGEMFRFLYGKVLCRPCHIIKRRRALVRKAKLEEDSGMSVDHANTGGWTVEDNNVDKDPMKKPPNAFLNDTDIDEDEQNRNQRVTVPLTITMLIIAAYIWAGSMIFHSFEQWTMIQAGYFCFITLGINKG
jgi:potassium channel subfamily K protein